MNTGASKATRPSIEKASWRAQRCAVRVGDTPLGVTGSAEIFQLLDLGRFDCSSSMQQQLEEGLQVVEDVEVETRTDTYSIAEPHSQSLLANPIIPVADLPEPKRGVILGVVVPTCEFAWSVIIFIRFGVIVGEAGVLLGLALVFLCALYLGVSSFQTIEIYGSAEGLLKTFSTSFFSNPFLDRAVVSCTLLVLTLTPVLLGTKMVHRLSAIFMVCLGSAFASVLLGIMLSSSRSFPPGDDGHGEITGIKLETLRANLWPSSAFQLKEPLSYLMPCFVGIYVGTNNAPELRDPLKDIPRGGFMAVSLSTILYTLLFVLIGSVATRERLISDTLILTQLAWPSHILSLIGIILVGVGSSMQCLVIASRVLVSLSDMNLLLMPNLFKRLRAGKELSTTVAVLITWFIAVPLVLIPNFEFLAILVTMCFLICYASTCFACFLLSVFRPPSWRPHFRAHWMFSLLGFLLCTYLMITLNWIAALGALIGSVVLSYVIQAQSEQITLGAGIQSLLYYVAINHLHMREEEDYQKNFKALVSHCQVADLQATAADRASPRSLLLSQALSHEPVILQIEQSLRSKFIVEGVWRPQVLGFITFESIDGRPRPEKRSSALVAFIGQMRSGSFRGGDLFILATTITPEDEEDALIMFSRRDEENECTVRMPEEVVIKELLFRRKILLRSMLEEERVFGFAKVCALWPSESGRNAERGDEQFVNIQWTSLIMGQNAVFLKVTNPSEFPSSEQTCGGSRSVDEAPLLRSEISAKLKLMRIKVHSIQVVIINEQPFYAATNQAYGVQNEDMLMATLSGDPILEDDEDILAKSSFFIKLKEEIRMNCTSSATHLVMMDYPCSDAWIVDSFERTLGKLLFRSLNSLCKDLDRVALVGTGSRSHMFAATSPLATVNRAFAGFRVEIHIDEPFISGQANAGRVVVNTLTLLSTAEALLAKDAGVMSNVDVAAELEGIFKKLTSLLSQSSIRQSPQEFLVSNGIIASFPRVAQHLNLQYYSGKSNISVPRDHFQRMTNLNQLTAMALQLRNDLKLTNHKYMAHQLALLYQAINLVGGNFTKFHARIQAQFESIKSLTSDPNIDEPQLNDDQKAWLSSLTSDIVNEVLFSDIKSYVIPQSLSQFIYNGPNAAQQY
ncbi:hypothetical protein HDU67_001649 [Dinochytrium kinnereticum]|nr:hypothetical protein HDU67_001649 [Dinochytrium kinnereticum]